MRVKFYKWNSYTSFYRSDSISCHHFSISFIQCDYDRAIRRIMTCSVDYSYAKLSVIYQFIKDKILKLNSTATIGLSQLISKCLFMKHAMNYKNTVEALMLLNTTVVEI